MRVRVIVMCLLLGTAPLPCNAARAVWGWELGEGDRPAEPAGDRARTQNESLHGGRWELERGDSSPIVREGRSAPLPAAATPARRRGYYSTDPRRRWVNPHPERGCLIYDENNKASWFPGCRER